ncbi:hypothetical protein [Brucella oryzae]|uniref:Uncharacterized protein n=1 Tax=Brucella oryzae TaxID=335286 RepID=A0A2S7IUY9_9HYPH|nr:hypothetical protein [Brucella oryzae]PQA71825.1 hypothetical protein C3731_19810 [Brucella oryzae]
MLKPIIVFLITLLLLVPVCLFVGYGIGEIIAAYVYPVTETPDRFREDRELFAGVYGIMFIGGFLYLAAVVFAVFRLVRTIRKRQI